MTKRNKKRLCNKKINLKLMIYSILLLFLTISDLFLIINLIKLNDIEVLFKNIVIICITIMNILLIVHYVFKVIIRKQKKLIIPFILTTIFIFITMFLNFVFNKVYNVFDDISKNYEEYTLSLVTLSSNDVDTIDNIDADIGVIGDENIENGYKYAVEIVKKNNIKQKLIKYETYLNIVEALYNDEIKYAFLPSNYIGMFSQDEKYINIGKELKLLHNDTKKVEVELVNNDVNKPFSVLLMGVDTLSSSYNADTLLLVTFNPDTLGATMLSIPRDTYTKIACTGGKHKINSSGWYSDKCVVDTVSKLVDINIDYYVKINFTGIVDLVNTLGGIDVNVPYAFCEQNSKREFGYGTVYVEEGFQHLDGEQALALSRNRHFWHGYCPSKYNEKGYYDNNLRNDITRGLNQQLVLKGILNSLTSVRDLNVIYNLLDIISNNISTNMSKDTMLSFYNIFKNIINSSSLTNIENTFDIQKLSLSVYGQYVNISGMNLSMVIAHQNSINVVSNAMKENLGLKDKEVIKTVSFNINDPYKETIIGSGLYGGTTLNLLDNLVGKTKEEVQSYCDKIGKECEFEYVEIDDNSYSNNQVIEQSVPANYDLSILYKTIVLKVAKVNSDSINKFNYKLCMNEEYKNNKNCLIPNFTNENISKFNDWYKNFSYIKVLSNKIGDITKDNNVIVGQNIYGKSIYEIYSENITLEIDYIFNETEVENTEDNDKVESEDKEEITDDDTSDNIDEEDEKNTE